MTNTDFYSVFYRHRLTRTSEAARLHLVDGLGIREAARKTGVDMAAVSRMVTALKRST